MSVEKKRLILKVCALAALLLAVTAVPVLADSNLIVNGDFSGGNTGFSSDYTYGSVSGGATYWIGTSPADAPGAYLDWGTYLGPFGSGNMLIANGGAGNVWSETLAVTSGTTYTFSYYGAQVDATSGSNPDLELFVNGTGVGSNVFPTNSPSNGGSWEQYTFTWSSGLDTSGIFTLVDLNTQFDYNDFAITDLSLTANSTPPTTTPEPGTLLMFGSGLFGLGVIRRRVLGV